ncbi:MAG: DUF1800 domain-containing protein [Bacteroidetes bacterium]|nr:MAG: DUF1800 domain-containing protein [Bacteroidota bacterium]
MHVRDIIMMVLMSVAVTGYAQVEDIFLGAGNDSSITVTTSNNHQLYTGFYTASGEKTVNGDGMNAARMDASRFLAQSTLSFNRAMIDQVLDIGPEAWIDTQFALPASYLTDTMIQIYDESKAIWVANGNLPENYTSMPNHVHLDYAWWQVSVRGQDQLRQRVAEALSQIVVVSVNSDLSGKALGMSSYFDILLEHAFGNYEDLMQDVTLNAGMGVWLTYVNNPATDTVEMTFPDENYARENMQLFTIGLDMLNQDGTPILDNEGDRIPTYDNDDIAQFAKIYTGLGYGDRIDDNDPYWGMGIYNADVSIPLIMYEDYHEPGPKYLLNGYIVPDGQTGLEDISEAITHLIDHPNVGPFIGKQLIQRLVKSNPTPAYVGAVSAAFNDNGQGVRGDMKAVIKAILMHPEARACSWVQHPQQGRLQEPILRKTQFAGLFNPIVPYPDKYWHYSYYDREYTDMHPLHSGSVFNFYSPDFAPNGAISDQGLVAPEFGIYNSRTSIGYATQLYRWIDSERLLQMSYYEESLSSPADLSVLLEYAKDPDALIDYLDNILTHGQLTNQTRAVIKSTLSEFGLSINDLVSKVSLATYLILLSPDYNIIK